MPLTTYRVTLLIDHADGSDETRVVHQEAWSASEAIRLVEQRAWEEESDAEEITATNAQ